jgi:hypothetical protein
VKFTIPASWGLQTGQGYAVQVNSQLNASAGEAATNRTFFDIHPSSGTPTGPVYLPTGSLNVAGTPVYTFNIGVTANTPVAIDPLIAIGYIFQTGIGDPNFLSVSLPNIGNSTPYDLLLWDGSKFVFNSKLNPNTVFSFGPTGVDRFEILGIDPNLALDPNNTMAFVATLTFAADGNFTGTMTPVTQDTTPLPAALPLFAGGLCVIGLLARRRQRFSHA